MVISTIAISLSRPSLSAIGETAGIARNDANFPDVADAPLDRPGSCGCPITSTSSWLAYVKARASTLVSDTTASQSVKATAPASCKKLSSVISWPCRPFVKVAIWWVFTIQADNALFLKNSRVSGLSVAGWVSGRVINVVTPPAAAASPADRKLSLCRSPGSQTLTPTSTIPGAKHLPCPSSVLAFGSSVAIKPSLMVIFPAVTVCF